MAANKNKYGQYFTIDVIADFMVSLISHPKCCKVMEPSCGRGVFLKYLAIHGFNNISACEIDSSLSREYEFVKHISFLSIPTTEKYSVVIGNPPYIRWKNLEPELKQELETNLLWNKYFNSLCDYMFIFILKSIEHLEEKGELIFICTEYWMNTTHSSSLRNYMCQNGYFVEIYHFKETPLFDKVTASFVIFKYIKTKERNNVITLYQYNNEKNTPNKDELVSRSCFSKKEIPSFTENKRWILAPQSVQDRLLHFETCCKKQSILLFDIDKKIHRIGDYCDIGNGMVSGLDKAFQIHNTEILNSREQRVLIDVLKAKDLNPYIAYRTTKYIFIQKDMEEEEFLDNYPHLAEHLKPYKEKLSCRYSYNKKIPYWRFVFPRNQKLFERNEPRIFIPCKERISNKKYFRFCYAPPCYFPTQDVTALFKKDTCKESLEYILAYLNNERIFEWISLNGIIKGDIVEFSETPLANIPFRPINWDSKDEIEIHNLITEETNLYLNNGKNEHLSKINNYFNILFYE